MKQWIDYEEFLAENGYDMQQDIGQFESLALQSFGVADSVIPGIAHVFSRYFHTTAFGTFVDIGMCKNEKDEYAIAYVNLPDWK